ncbi:MAG TPA: choice-of-anchor tandem repeat GloVer-containing protein [Rhizomicrobium sp.]|jgi:uncharacterized repeat protein (TIGR03803 family)|nr:choice-of-anchor tandem repeat GloVer-containing protein [Rhizomicrobium sp.]
MNNILHMFHKWVGCLLPLALFVPLHGAGANSSFKLLYSFPGGALGAFPYSGLTRDASGNLYGTTYAGGGTGCHNGGGCGTVFKLKPDGTAKVLHVFKGGRGDGAYPMAGLIMDAVGNLYGTTSEGGNAGCDSGYGCGTVFKLKPGGKETVLYAFRGGSDGGNPYAGVIMDAKGNLFGTTLQGGMTCPPDSYGCGVVFKISPEGTETVLYSFCQSQNCPDGAFPTGGLIAKNDNLYGTASQGGNCVDGIFLGCGVVFRLARDGTETVLYNFRGAADGQGPSAGVVADKAGNFYGTTACGGDCSSGAFGCGTVFKLAPDGTETVLHSFQSGHDGDDPAAGVILDAKDNVYRTTYAGGNTGCYMGEGCGTVFKVAPNGTETISTPSRLTPMA